MDSLVEHFLLRLKEILFFGIIVFVFIGTPCIIYIRTKKPVKRNIYSLFVLITLLIILSLLLWGTDLLLFGWVPLFIFIGIPCIIYNRAKDPVKRDRWAYSLFILVTLLMVAYHFWAEHITRNPLDMPVSLSEGIDTTISVPLSESYTVCLDFYVNDNNLRRKIFEDEDANKGVEIPIQWEIYSTSGELVKSEISVTSESTAGNRIGEILGIRRDLGRTYLKQGEYRFVAHTLKDIPEFANFEARMILDLGSYKYNSSWQKETIFLINFVFMYPIIFIYFTLLILLICTKLKKIYYERKK